MQKAGAVKPIFQGLLWRVAGGMSMAARFIGKRYVGIAAAAALIVVAFLLPCPEGLSQEAKMAVALMFAGLILWTTEAMPNGISALMLMALMPYFGIFTFSELWAKFISSAFFFVMVSFALSTALGRTSIPLRANALILRWVGHKPRNIVLGFMIVAAAFSTLCSNIATVAMVMSFTVELLKAGGCKPKESRFGRCLVMGVVYGAIIGGCATLSGSSSHIMLLSITESAYGFGVSFTDWLIVSLPLVLIMVPITWLSLVKIYKPEPIPDSAIDQILLETKTLGPMPARDKAFGIFLALIFLAWMASTWVPALNLTAVSLFALAIMFLPGIEFLNFDSFVKGVSWNVLLVMGGVIALTAGISSTGGVTWFIELIEPFFLSFDHTVIYLFASVFACLVHCIAPTGSATAGIATLPLMELARITGANPTAIFHIVGWWAGGIFIMPVDSILLLAYSYGYTEFKDPVKAGIIPTIALIVLSSTLTPFIIETFNIGMPLP